MCNIKEIPFNNIKDLLLQNNVKVLNNGNKASSLP